MKNRTNFILLCAGILLSLTGCQEKVNNEEPSVSGNYVKFSATTSPQTRTAYSGEIKNGKERIDWMEGDQILIWSDIATVKSGAAPYFSGNDKLAIYSIGSITASDEKSVASIADNQGAGLIMPDKTTKCQFWGVYPGEVVTANEDGNPVTTFTIQTNQALAANTNTTDAAIRDYVPDMKQAVLLAYVKDATAAKTVEIPFNPAYTAFEFNIKTGTDTDLTIKSVELKSTNSPLSGSFTAACNSDGVWGYTIDDAAEKSVKATLPSPLTINNSNSLYLTIFTLPQLIDDLTVTFDTNEGTKSLKLVDKTQPDKPFIKFEACKKHKFDALVLPTGWYFSYITLDLQVLEWEAVDFEGDSKDFPQATQFSVSGEGVRNGGPDDLNVGNGAKDPYRQQWYFQPGQTVTVFFKVMLPAGGTWEVEVVGGTEENPVEADAALFTVKNISPDATSQNQLYGAIHETGSTDVKLEITYNGTDTAQHSFYFHTYAYSGANRTGTKFNIDSETQIYDRGRGYHTFIVNSPLYQTE